MSGMHHLSGLQQLVRQRFLAHDKEHSSERAFAFFIEEVGELARAISRRDRDNMEEEIGEVLMWLLSLANLHDIDIDRAVDRYLADPANEVPK